MVKRKKNKSGPSPMEISGGGDLTAAEAGATKSAPPEAKVSASEVSMVDAQQPAQSQPPAKGPHSLGRAGGKKLAPQRRALKRRKQKAADRAVTVLEKRSVRIGKRVSRSEQRIKAKSLF